MNVSLTAELERWVQDRVATGRYTSASEVVREALRIMQDKEQGLREWLVDTRAKVQAGLDELDRGEGIPGDHARAELARRSAERRKQRAPE